MNKFTNTKIEFHILQSFPVSCLNRDDVGAPKSAFIGGVERARVSSQCWKRAVRMELQNQGIKIAERTRLVVKKIAEQCIKLGASPEEAEKCGNDIAAMLTKTVKDGQSDTLFFISNAEAEAIAMACKTSAAADDLLQTGTFSAMPEKELKKLLKGSVISAVDGLDIALFGRMVAQAPDLNVEAAASFAHAVSTHKVVSEVDFFTAVDDMKKGDDDAGAAHMGSLEFNSATYYRYVSLDLGQLADNLHSEDLDIAVDAFVKALFIANPSARQTTMAAVCPWNYAIVTLRKGQGLQLPFNTPVRPGAGEDMVSASIGALQTRFADVKRMYGSLFGCCAEFEIGTESGDIDTLLAGLKEKVNAL